MRTLLSEVTEVGLRPKNLHYHSLAVVHFFLIGAANWVYCFQLSRAIERIVGQKDGANLPSSKHEGTGHDTEENL